jgi:hypothetical protein
VAVVVLVLLAQVRQQVQVRMAVQELQILIQVLL